MKTLLAVSFAVAAVSVAAAQTIDPAMYGDMRWRAIGLFRGGRTVGAAGVVRQPNVFYIGVNNDGVWKTTDYGQTWTPIFDDQPTQSIGAIAVAPSDPNVIYVGSGEGLQRPDLSVGDGIYKSIDAGRTWQHVLFKDDNTGAIDLAFDPVNAQTVYAVLWAARQGPWKYNNAYAGATNRRRIFIGI